MRFTIRDLLWLTVVVALGVAWWVDRRRQAARIDGLEKQVASYQTAILEPVFWPGQFDSDKGTFPMLKRRTASTTPPSANYAIER